MTSDNASRLADRTIPALLFVAVAVFAIHKIVAYDVWWQLATGNWVVSHGIPTTDPFSYAAADRPWIEMRWLFCAAEWLVSSAFGLNGLIVAKTIVVLAAFACLWLVDPKAPAWARSLGVACALAIAHLRLTERPELVTFVLLTFTLLAINRYRSGGRAAWIYALPVLQIVWTNAHTLFVLGPVTLWIVVVSELAARYAPIPTVRARALTLDRLRPLVVAATASTLACLVNPYFLRGALFPVTLFAQIQSGNAIRELITELQSPFAYAGLTTFFLRYPVVVGISALGFVLNRRRIVPSVLALWCAFLYLSAQSERNLGLFGFVAGFAIVVNYGEVALPAVAWTARAACAALALVAIPAVATDAYYQRLDPSRRFGFGVAKNRFPIRAMAFADANFVTGRILCNLVDGNYVLFDRGAASVYLDGRLEVYGGDVVEEADDLFKTGNGFDAFVARNNVGTVLVAHRTDGNLFRVVNRHDDWAPVYFDETHVLFVRVTPETRGFVATRRIDWNAPVRTDIAIPARLDPPDWLAGLWPKAKDDVAEKALGQLALLTGNLPLARDHFDAALAVRPDDADAALPYGVVCRALGDDARADEWLAKAGGNATQIRTALGAAQAFESANSYEAAVATYEAVVTRGGGSPDIDQRLAQAALAANRLDVAEAAFRRLTAARPDAEQVWNGLGLVATRRGEYDVAVESFERSLAINPKQAAVLTGIGNARASMGQPELAREAFARALEIDPNYQPARRQLGALGGA